MLDGADHATLNLILGILLNYSHTEQQQDVADDVARMYDYLTHIGLEDGVEAPLVDKVILLQLQRLCCKL